MARAIKTKTSLEVKQEFEFLFRIYATPRILQTDNGGEFVSRELSGLLYDKKTVHITSRPRYPQSNGKIDRVNGTVKRTLALLASTSENRERWIDEFEDVVCQYNHAWHNGHKNPLMRHFLAKNQFSHTRIKLKDPRYLKS
eukprot:GHVP01034554.1.p1 GENE.GHVP01034554.1~~GHVP01034554.1.p1  ORF type:complete len:141 (+),score=9.46 GHVP01034554.1:2-424(+)